MSGTVAGGRKAAKTNLRRFGPSYYARIGGIGGRVKSPTKGFGHDTRSWLERLLGMPSYAQLAGRRGGLKSRKT